MNKLLYISDQEEYSENGTISTLFDNYLREYWEVDIVYFTPYKHSLQKKLNHIIVPTSKRKNLIKYLDRKIGLLQYDFMFIRNKKDILFEALKYKNDFKYKVGYRVSYPKKYHKLKSINFYTPKFIIGKLMYNFKINKRDKLINECDLFLPASNEAKDKFYPNINIDSFPIFIGLDPDILTNHQINKSEVTNFINVGTIDKLRKFNIVLDAFNSLESKNWILHIITTDKDYLNRLLKHYAGIKEKIVIHTIYKAEDRKNKINECDVGIALLPPIDLYDTVIANKVIDYYNSGIPTIMTSNEKNHSIFFEDEAYFSKFIASDIKIKFEDIINKEKDTLARVGKNGQNKLLKLKRNYKILAKDLASRMNDIIKV
jgi:hypothetical protein